MQGTLAELWVKYSKHKKLAEPPCTRGNINEILYKIDRWHERLAAMQQCSNDSCIACKCQVKSSGWQNLGGQVLILCYTRNSVYRACFVKTTGVVKVRHMAWHPVFSAEIAATSCNLLTKTSNLFTLSISLSFQLSRLLWHVDGAQVFHVYTCIC